MPLIMASAPVAWLNPVAAPPVLIAGIALAQLGQLARRATGMTGVASLWSDRVVDLGAAAALATIVAASQPIVSAIILALVLTGLIVLDRRLGPSAGEPNWLADVPGYAILVGLGMIWGGPGLVVGLAVAVVHGFATLAWRQNSLSRALTPTR